MRYQRRFAICTHKHVICRLGLCESEFNLFHFLSSLNKSFNNPIIKSAKGLKKAKDIQHKKYCIKFTSAVIKQIIPKKVVIMRKKSII